MDSNPRPVRLSAYAATALSTRPDMNCNEWTLFKSMLYLSVLIMYIHKKKLVLEETSVTCAFQWYYICPSVCLFVCHTFSVTLCSWWRHMCSFDHCLFCLPPFAKAGVIKTHSSVCPSVCPSVTKTLTLLISSKVLLIEHWYLARMILLTSPLNWHHVMTLTLTFDLLQGQS